MIEYEASAKALEGTRYLSGYLERSPADWEQHYGGALSAFRRAKAHYDCRHVLNPGFVQWPAEHAANT